MKPSPRDIIRLTDSFEDELISPALAPAPDVCEICCDWTEEPPTCLKCQHASEVLGTALARVVPITLYVKPSSMRDRLTYYKDPRGPEDASLATEVASMFERFFMEHAGELARRYGEFDVATVVPTTTRTCDRHPLDDALARLPAESLPEREELLDLGSGAIERRQPSPHGFVARASATGRRVLVLDDVYTTGATAQSAVHALTIAGATVPVVVVAGRRLNPEAFPPVATIVERQRGLGYSFRQALWGPP